MEVLKMSYYTKLRPNGTIEAHCIDEPTTEGAVEMLRKLISVNVIVPSRYVFATVDYDCSQGLEFDKDKLEHFSLRFKGNGAEEPLLMVYPITAGYGGSGPTACFQCLELMGFVHGDMDDYPEIFQKKTFVQNGHICEDPKVHLIYTK